MSVLRRYTFKLYPKAGQATALHEQRRMMGELWNALLQRREDVYRREGRTLGKREQYKEITALRAECPEWAALSVAAARGVADRLDNAFKAFFKRAKSGAGRQSGYPRYKRSAEWQSISFTERSGSGWHIRQVNPSKGGWRIYAKGCRGEIKARGELPAEPLSWRTGELLWRDDAWWLSVVCEMEPRRKPGTERIKISFDLIDEFALVEGAKGRSPACSKEQITPHSQRDMSQAPADTPNLGGDGNSNLIESERIIPADTPNLGGDGNKANSAALVPCPADTPNLGGDGNTETLSETATDPADTPNLGGDGNPPNGAHAHHLPADTPNLGGDGNSPSHASRNAGPADTPNLGGDGNHIGIRTMRLLPADTPNLGGDGNRYIRFLSVGSPADTPNLGGDGNVETYGAKMLRPADPPNLGGDGNEIATSPIASIQSNRDRRYRKFSWRWRREKKRIAHRQACEARRRRYAHHLWSTEIVRRAKDVTVTVPAIPQWTESPRGNVRNWGANVAAVSRLNQHVLGQAPMLAVQMLQYKAQESGIRCDVAKDEAPNIAVGAKLVAAGKTLRKAKRALRKAI